MTKGSTLLKSIPVFAKTLDYVLPSVAAITDELDRLSGETFIREGSTVTTCKVHPDYIEVWLEVHEPMPIKQSYDVVIVGAGAAGAILAARLSEDPARSVLLLEAGPDYPTLEAMPIDLKYGHGAVAGGIATSHDWGYVGEATAQTPPMPVLRGKVVGGSSATNAQILLRGLAEDFAQWAACDNDLWVFDHVLPYFRKLETDLDFRDEFHGAHGPIYVQRYAAEAWQPDQAAFYRACRAAGFPHCSDMNRPHTSGVGSYPLNTHNHIRQSTAVCYLQPARQRANLTIRGDVHVQRILFSGQQATGVAALVAGQTATFSAGEVILSAGAIGSPHLLMLSGIGAVDSLRRFGIPIVADLPGVGHNLQDHPRIKMEWSLQRSFTPNAETHPLQVGLRYTATGSAQVNDMIVYLFTDSREEVLIVLPTLNLPHSAGELCLVAADAQVQPKLSYRYLSEPFDRERLREAIHLCRDLVEDGAFDGLVGERRQPEPAVLTTKNALDDWARRVIATGQHTSCTCKMGPATDRKAVVDQMGAVYGVRGLRVVDASIMPACVRANTNATTMMMAEYIADMIRHDC